MDRVTVLIGLTTATLNGIGYVIYNIRAQKGVTRPNPASWGIWTALALIDVFWFREVAGSWVFALHFAVGTVACLFTFGASMARGKMDWPSALDWTALGLGAATIAIWLSLSNAPAAGPTLMAVYVISFWPIARGVWLNPERETSAPWWIWTVAYVLMVTNVWRSDRGLAALTLTALLTVGHAVVAVLASRRTGQKRAP